MHKAFGTKRALPVAVTLLAILGLLPIRYIAWVGFFGGIAENVVYPLSHPMSVLRQWLTPSSPHDPSDPAIKKLQGEIGDLTTQLLRARLENGKLLRQLEEQTALRLLNPEVSVSHINAPVIGVSSDLSSGLLTVRAGRKHGAEANTVAVVNGLQLLGRVVDADQKSCKVQPITRKAAGKIRGRVMFEAIEDGLGCILESVGDGTLRGDTGDATQGKSLEPAVGQLVRLDDVERWPEHAQMLVIGKIESVEPSPRNPLRKVITVRPTVALDRVSEVILRIAAEPADAPVAGGPP